MKLPRVEHLPAGSYAHTYISYLRGAYEVKAVVYEACNAHDRRPVRIFVHAIDVLYLQLALDPIQKRQPSGLSVREVDAQRDLDLYS